MDEAYKLDCEAENPDCTKVSKKTLKVCHWTDALEFYRERIDDAENIWWIRNEEAWETSGSFSGIVLTSDCMFR